MLLADARRTKGDKFSLREFHDYLWTNVNVPISLLRLEYLKDARDVPENRQTKSAPRLLQDFEPVKQRS